MRRRRRTSTTLLIRALRLVAQEAKLPPKVSTKLRRDRRFRSYATQMANALPIPLNIAAREMVAFRGPAGYVETIRRMRTRNLCRDARPAQWVHWAAENLFQQMTCRNSLRYSTLLACRVICRYMEALRVRNTRIKPLARISYLLGARFALTW